MNFLFVLKETKLEEIRIHGISILHIWLGGFALATLNYLHQFK